MRGRVCWKMPGGERDWKEETWRGDGRRVRGSEAREGANRRRREVTEGGCGGGMGGLKADMPSYHRYLLLRFHSACQSTCLPFLCHAVPRKYISGRSQTEIY